MRALRESCCGRGGEDRERFEVFRHEIEPMAELEALQKKAEAGCGRHEVVGVPVERGSKWA